MRGFTALLIAIATEVIGTAALKATDGFARWIPVIIVLIGYGASFYFLGLALKHIPLGVAYAVWSGLGMVGIVLIGYLVWNETLSIVQVTGIVLILIGVVLLNMTTPHAA